MPNPAGDRILGSAPVSGAPHPILFPSKPGEDPPNGGQMEAMFSCLGRDTTFIWGPPGTGKTKTIGMIGEQLFRRNRSLLLVSHTNTAVDEALVKIADAVGNDFKEATSFAWAIQYIKSSKTGRSFYSENLPKSVKRNYAQRRLYWRWSVGHEFKN
jgi:Cdc6-like AAA superfamily ATPase